MWLNVRLRLNACTIQKRQFFSVFLGNARITLLQVTVLPRSGLCRQGTQHTSGEALLGQPTHRSSIGKRATLKCWRANGHTKCKRGNWEHTKTHLRDAQNRSYSQRQYNSPRMQCNYCDQPSKLWEGTTVGDTVAAAAWRSIRMSQRTELQTLKDG